MARAKGLDLVEVAATVKPPVCKIMDFGKYSYEQSKKAKVAKKKQHTVHLKEMRFRPKTEEHDYQFKLKHIIEFLKASNKVKIFIEYRGRELVHKELGVKVIADIAEYGSPEGGAKMEGRSLSLIFIAKKPGTKKAD
jgi:translation initiation factor IF-3